MTTMDANALRDTIFIDPATGAGTKAPEVRAVAQHHSAIERAVAHYERQAAALAPGGRPIYTDHAERLAALQAETDQAFIVAEEELGALFRQAVADEEAAAATNPMDRLDEAEITRANSRRAFVNEDAERLPLGELVQRVQRVLAGDDRALWFLWLRAADQRLKAAQAGGHVAPSDQDAARSLTDALRELGQRFVDEKALAKAQARQAVLREGRTALPGRGYRIQREVERQRRSGRYDVL